MATEKEVVAIKPPKFRTICLEIEGTSPFVQLKFSEKSKAEIRGKHEAGGQSKSKKTRQARDFSQECKDAQHISQDGWVGIPAPAFRSAAIDVCRMVGFKMTHAKMSIFILADGYDKDDGTPLVRLNAGDYEETVMAVRNATGVADLRARPMWREWGCYLRVKYDEDQFSADDVVNLVSRSGLQVGVGEGRSFSKSSNGMGWGSFTIKSTIDV
jgi:hypothetical protein